MIVDEFKIMEDCIERGIQYGYRRAFKHTDNPPEEHIIECLQSAVLNSICEYFKFEDINKEK